MRKRPGALILLLLLGVTAQAADLECDVCVVGGGSGGIGAALAAAREGAKVIVVEKQGILGGTMTASMVCAWGSGPGDSTARELYERLSRQNKAYATTFRGKAPYHLWAINKSKTYADSLRRPDGRGWDGVNICYDPDAMAATALELLSEHGVTVLLNTTFTDAATDGKRVTQITAVSSPPEVHSAPANRTTMTIRAKVFIDATGDVYLCRDAGCETVIGKDLNGITLCYRVRRGGKEDPDVIKVKPNKTWSSNNELPNGDRMINMLPTLPGTYIGKHGYEQTVAECRKRIRSHWAFLRKGPGDWKEFRFADEARALGIREGYRITGEYTLSAGDLKTGYYEQPHKDMIALSEHPADFHGGHKGKKPKVKPYGIPYRCMIPKGWKNILVPCRGAGFDRVAASSARLQRTMLWMGHAAGIGAAQAAKKDGDVRAVDVPSIVKKVGMDRASVDAMLGKALPALGPESARTPIVGNEKHAFLCTDNGLGKILKFDESGTLVWEYPAPRCQDVWMLENRNILFTSYTAGKKPVGSVHEVTPDKRVVMKAEFPGEVHGCQRLADGNTLVGVCGKNVLAMLDPSGKTVREIPLPSSRQVAHYNMRQVRMTPQKTVLVTLPKDRAVIELDLDGKVLKRFVNVGNPFAAVRLANGNTLVGGGDACTVTEVDSEGKVVWKLKASDVPAINYKWAAGVHRIPNGNTVVCNWLGHGQAGKGVPVFEVTPEKKVVWQFTDARTTRSVSSVCVLAPGGKGSISGTR